MIYPNDTKPHVCFSGGAIGVDDLFGQCAHESGHKVIHYHFEEKKRGKPFFKILTREELSAADPYVKAANRFLRRSFPSRSEHTNDLLRRNYYQIVDSDRVYAVAPIDPENGFVKGGTAWACEMFLNKRGTTSPLYLFDTTSEAWYEWDYIFKGFDKMKSLPPIPFGHYTGIGTRYPSEVAQDAIKNLYFRK